MAWIKGRATDHLDLLAIIAGAAVGESLTAAVINAGGTGYTVGDELTISGGTSVSAAVVRVTAVSSGVVTGIIIISAGAYSVNPSATAATTGGTGSGATVDVTLASNGWTARTTGVESYTQSAISGFSDPVNDPDATGLTNAERRLVVGRTIDSEIVDFGIRTYRWRTMRGWTYGYELAGFQTYPTDDFDSDEVVRSPGKYQENFRVEAPRGAYVPLANSPIDFFLSVTSRRIAMATVIDGHCQSAYMGYCNPYGDPDIAQNFSRPMVIAGTTCDPTTRYDDNLAPTYGGIACPVGSAAAAGSQGNGPFFFRFADLTYRTMQSAYATDRDLDLDQRTKENSNVVLPMGELDYTDVPGDDRWFDTGFTFPEFADPAANRSEDVDFEIVPTTNSGGNVRPRFPITFLRIQTNINQLIGELDGVFWVPGSEDPRVGDVIEDGSDRFRMFPIGNLNQPYAWFALEEK